MKKLIAGVAALAFTSIADASVVCQGCEAGDDAGTFLGLYNPLEFDLGTFQHSDLAQELGPSAAVMDSWVFDLQPGGHGSISADFTTFAPVNDFAVNFYQDGGSTCTGNDCSSVVLGTLLATASAINNRWEILTSNLAAGRYIFQVTGSTPPTGASGYGGQLAFIPEPGTALMFGLGLGALVFLRNFRRDGSRHPEME